MCPKSTWCFPRAYVEFVDPADPEQVMRCDLTWLTSSYMCIFGQGCQGIYESAPDVGCCTLGAHFSDKADQKRVATYVAAAHRGDLAVPPRPQGAPQRLGRRPTTRARPRPAPTRSTGRAPACSPTATTSPPAPAAPCTGSRSQQGRNPLETKPDVCWQLPIRRTFRNVERQDGTTYTEVSIGEYDRRGWGAGGHDLDWYCSGNTEAHVAAEPVYVTHEPELTELMGRPAYDELVRHCEAHVRSRSALALHPADPH